MTKSPFFILSYPRSRTAWLACALSTGHVECLHEGLLGCTSLEDLGARLNATAAEWTGNSDAGNAFLINGILARWPDARLVVVTRDTDSVATSMRRLGISLPEDVLKLIAAGLETGRRAGALMVDYREIGSVEVGHRIWDHCAQGVPFDAERWRRMDALNIQIRSEVAFDQFRRNAPKFRQLYEATR